MNSEKLQQLIDMMNDNDLKIIKVKSGKDEYYVEKAVQEIQYVPQAPVAGAPQVQGGVQEMVHGDHIQKSQLVGTYYNMQDETSKEPFIRVGDKVEKGDRIGIIEAMKVMNDVYADVDGTIEEIFVQNGTAVAYDEPLVRIKEK
ncbi:acetyl-CoA carboxylase biotin carboxyl carrier protein [Macrococcoides canis]|uniref:Acetyl-CoA carboxylase biotin carboxyl carrier protein subunit n=1 Tax=Macrococcoides canis TaxID=1855823 RepID=A0A4V3BGC0_9STAP|nr:acetyl-CoA carboxylase biotin carboxyl carrier protein subunit [Macrococcus canis]MEE1108426.1 acetyl-CoA carboxylase biotin carboxyl carrier protein subunit [Macrococcus canis]TDM18685.1 acetyl-CoA carboxylase biotin carboxyl carrier protein subunit [Macrococcus canis]TDM21265.1 acetyl-CoA carboxylase biotin carboxyl carrier protein subunit [Macrococcus canis]TDM29809.1 acetyl-CoA carboxylase biotin carboxyl carrier protein subunit [Macrococcus canis]TDM35157.1 acetyl-CoA carboxylase bioti